MATLLKTTGNATPSSEFRYNTIYKENNGEYTENTEITATGKGEHAYIYGDFKANEYRDAEISDGGVGMIFGEISSRSGVGIGSVTESGKFSYNGGLRSEDNIPSYYTDDLAEVRKTEATKVYTFDKKNTLYLRNTDSVEDGTKNL